MAEEQVMKVAENLVLPGFSEKLRNMQLNNLTAKQQEKLEIKKHSFFQAFKELSHSFFGLSKDQIKELNDNELVALDELISCRAWPWAIFQMLFTFGVPLFGWFCGALFFLDVFYSWPYFHYKKYLMKACGKEFLSETLKQRL